MASQPALKRADATVAEPRKRGRPLGSASLTPEEKRLRGGGAIDYNRWNNTFQKPQEFYTYLAGYPDKRGLLAYLYRLKPIIDVTLIGIEDVSIHRTKDEAEMGEEWVAANFGRGVYKLTLNDANRPKGQKEVAHTFFDLSNCSKPPVYDPRTLVLTENKNLDEINRLINLGVMVRERGTGQPRLRTDSDGTPFPGMPPAPAAAAPSAGAVGALDLNTVVANLLMRSAASPHDAVRDTIAMAQAIQPQFNIDDVVRRVAVEMGGGRRQRDEDPFAIYERIDNLLQKRNPAPSATASALTNAAVDAGAPSWVPHLPAIFAEARQLIPEVMQAWREMRTESGAGSAQNGGGHEVQKQPQQPTMEQRIEHVARLGFQKMNEGTTGFDFAAYVCGFMPGGLEVFTFLEQSGGAAGFIGLMSMKPAGAKLVNDPQIRPQLEVFLTDFFSFDPSGGAAEESAEADSAAAA